MQTILQNCLIDCKCHFVFTDIGKIFIVNFLASNIINGEFHSKGSGAFLTS